MLECDHPEITLVYITLIITEISGLDRCVRTLVNIALHCASYMCAFMILQKLSIFSQISYQIQEICQKIKDIWSTGLDARAILKSGVLLSCNA